MTQQSHCGFLRLCFIAIALSAWFATNTFAAPIQMAVTVDDLPAHADILASETRLDVTKKVIEVLQKHGIKDAYGFINPHKVDEHPETKTSLEVWRDAGLPLGNHTYSHMNLTKNSAADFIADVRRAEPLIQELVPSLKEKWFRYPFLFEGNTLEKRNAVRQALHEMNYRIAQVTVDFEDWAWNNPYVRCKTASRGRDVRWLENSYIQHSLNRLKFVQQASQRLFGRDIRHILLLHVGTFDAKMLDRLLTVYEKRGVQFISLSEAASDAAYLENPDIPVERGDGFLVQLLTAKQVQAPWVEPLPLKKLNSLCR